MAPRWQRIVISTHFDDAALSVSGFLARQAAATAIVTVFGGLPASTDKASGWDSQCGFDSAADAARSRQREDALACQILGADQVMLPYPDTPYLAEAEHTELTELTGFLADHVTAGTQVLVPAGIGNVDHMKVSDWALSALRTLTTGEILLYADLPYSVAHPEWPGDIGGMFAPGRLEQVLERNLPAYRITASDTVALTVAEWRCKRAAIFAHASQLALLGSEYELFLAFPGSLQHEALLSVTSSG
jgi:LmbE family N-acetylglucosaminyl deacetylase